VVSWLRGEGKAFPPLTGRFLYGTEELVHAAASEEPGEREIIQFCGDIPEKPIENTVLLEALHKLTDCIGSCLGIDYARIRICTTDVEENHVLPRKPLKEALAETPPPTDAAS
jgi:hypothetical protein